MFCKGAGDLQSETLMQIVLEIAKRRRMPYWFLKNFAVTNDTTNLKLGRAIGTCFSSVDVKFQPI